MNRQLCGLVLAMSSFSLIEMHPFLSTFWATIFVFKLLEWNHLCVDFAKKLMRLQWIAHSSVILFLFYLSAYHYYWSKIPYNAVTIFWFSSMSPLVTGISFGANLYLHVFREGLPQNGNKNQT